MSRLHLSLVLLVVALAGCAAVSPSRGRTNLPAAHAVTASPASPIPPSPPPAPTLAAAPDVAARIDAYLTKLVAQGRFSGAVLVAKDGAVLLSKGYGLADRDTERPNTPGTHFLIASLTKSFTAAAILALQGQGKLDVQDSVCDYLDPCEPNWQAITIHHLLTHSAGLPPYEPRENRERTPDEVLAVFADAPLRFAPGAGFDYSNAAYQVLGVVIERASGQSYGEFLQQQFFTPLKMADTGYGAPADLAHGYVDKGPVPLPHYTMVFAAGGLYSTVEDLYRWDQALYTDTPLPAALREQMFAPQIAIEGEVKRLSYGYGWFLDEFEGVPRSFHGGYIDGFVGALLRFPENRASVILLCNQQHLEDAVLAAEPMARMLLQAR